MALTALIGVGGAWALGGFALALLALLLIGGALIALELRIRNAEPRP